MLFLCINAHSTFFYCFSPSFRLLGVLTVIGTLIFGKKSSLQALKLKSSPVNKSDDFNVT